MALAPHEQEFLDRLNSNPNPLGWTPCGRDENGVAQVRCSTSLGRQQGVKITVIKITEKGLVYMERKFPAREPDGTG